MRLAHALESHEGIEGANANLMGQVTLAWDDARTSRDAIVERRIPVLRAFAGLHRLAVVERGRLALGMLLGLGSLFHAARVPASAE